MIPIDKLPPTLRELLSQKRPGVAYKRVAPSSPAKCTPRVLHLSMQKALNRGPTPSEWHALRAHVQFLSSEHAARRRKEAEAEADA